MRRLAAALVGALAALALTAPATALAAGPYPYRSAGYDISWPQCGGPYPDLVTGWYGTVGVNDGRPFTMNPCFASEMDWALRNQQYAGIYMYMGYGESLDGARPCVRADRGCRAYNYGWGAAEYAFVSGLANTAGASEAASVWWLDVEEDSNWDPNPALNAMVLQGAIDYLRSVQGVQVGIYSVESMWRPIAGGYAPPGVGNWIAGGANRGDFGSCTRALWPGAPVWMFQTLEDGQLFDVDRGC